MIGLYKIAVYNIILLSRGQVMITLLKQLFSLSLWSTPWPWHCGSSPY